MALCLPQHGGSPGQCDQPGRGPARPLSHLWQPRLQHQVFPQSSILPSLLHLLSLSHHHRVTILFPPNPISVISSFSLTTTAPPPGCGTLRARRVYRRSLLTGRSSTRVFSMLLSTHPGLTSPVLVLRPVPCTFYPVPFTL